MSYYNLNKQPILLGPQLGMGGEATVFAVNSDPKVVAKIYRTPTPAHAVKLQAMIANPPVDPTLHQGHVSIAWPTELVYDAQNLCVGLLLPRIDFATSVPLLKLYNPKARRQKAPTFTWQYLMHTAGNLASVVEAVHRRGYIIGDLNESNLLVRNTALITLVDCDSMQVITPNGQVLRCTVGKGEYTPPELQGVDFPSVDRSSVHDNFGLAILIFMLLMEGNHPYHGVWHGSGNQPTTEDNIRAGRCPYIAAPNISPPGGAPPIDILPPDVQNLVRRCFGLGHSNPYARPTPQEWQDTLNRAATQLLTCKVNSQHRFSPHLQNCPWCERRAKFNIDAFPAIGQASAAVTKQIALPAATFTTQHPNSPAQQPLRPKAQVPRQSAARRGMLLVAALGVVMTLVLWPQLSRIFSAGDTSGGQNFVSPPAAASTSVIPTAGLVAALDTPVITQLIIVNTPTIQPALPPSKPMAVANTGSDRIILRPGPGKEYGEITRYPSGTNMSLLGRSVSGEWLNVNVDGGMSGWVMTQWVTTNVNIADLAVIASPPLTVAQNPVQSNGHILFATNRDDPNHTENLESHIYIMNADGSDQTRLTFGQQHHLFPDWSPDGSHIVYMAGPNAGCSIDPPAGDIFTMNIDGSGVSQVTYGLCARWPKWSPDGNWIVFGDHTDKSAAKKTGDGYDVYVVAAGGGSPTQVTNAQGFDGFPAWTPDGDIIFTSERAGNENSQIYITDMQGLSVRPLTSGAGEKWNAVFSQDGNRIAYASNQGGSWNIYTMAADGSNVQQITSGGGTDKYPSWSPDGNWIAFHSNRDGRTNYEIYTVASRGGSVQRLTYEERYDDEPAWR